MNPTMILPERKSPAFFSRLKPQAPINWLVAAAGFTWSAVGILLCKQACGWLSALVFGSALLSGTFGMLGALAAYQFIFLPIAMKNIDRLSLFHGKACFFAFQAWKSYLIIIVMIALGTVLRHSMIPRSYLAALYLGIGGALLLSSFHYYAKLRHLNFPRKPS